MRSFDSPAVDLTGKAVLVTGGTGSFGRRFVAQVIERYKPRRLIVFSRDEYKQYEMQQIFSGEAAECLRYFIGDVRDCDRLEMAMRGVDVVIHGAALKHVPAAEYNPIECIHTNVNGAENVVKAALRAEVPRIIALSTDKAANPVNLYGASKLASDKIFVAANHLSHRDGPRFSVVRYGNVVGSRGSVLPLFQRLVAQGASSLPITDPRMTRFWITLNQGVNFVLSSLAMMGGGEIFVPKIPSMRVVDLARMIAPELEQAVIGIRPGEKLHEVMITEDDARNTVELDDRYVVLPNTPSAGSRPYLEHAKVMDEHFRYCSETNPEWVNVEQMRQMMLHVSD